MNPKQFEFVSKVAFTKFCPCVISLQVSASVYIPTLKAMFTLNQMPT